jgi:hypothetical protein
VDLSVSVSQEQFVYLFSGIRKVMLNTDGTKAIAMEIEVF